LKVQLGGLAETDLFSQLGTQETASGIQNVEDPGLLLLTTDRTDENAGILEIGRSPDIGHGNELIKSGVLDVVLDKVGDLPADEHIDALNAVRHDRKDRPGLPGPFHTIKLQDIAIMEITEPFHADTAFVTGNHFTDIIFEAFQAANGGIHDYLLATPDADG
jgi:hypothetical protein